jgi:beta-phosphoglucomutase-like phosphatase (HAD superfamily)
MSAILWDLDGTIQDSEPLFRESIRHGFIEVLGREPSGDEVSQDWPARCCHSDRVVRTIRRCD